MELLQRDRVKSWLASEQEYNSPPTPPPDRDPSKPHPDMLFWSLKGIMIHVETVARSYFDLSDEAAIDFRGKHLSETADCPGLRKLPYPMQKMVVQERKIALAMLEDGEGVERDLGDGSECSCRFFTKWLLPCRHLWMAEALWGGVLSEEKCEAYVFCLKSRVSNSTRNGTLNEKIGISLSSSALLHNKDSR